MSPRVRQDSALALLGLLIVAAAACADKAARPPGSSSRPAAPVADAMVGAMVAPPAPAGTLRMVFDDEPNHLNPNLDPDRSCFRLAFDTLYEPLVRAMPGGDYVPVLADRFTVDDEGQSYTFHLRPGVMFHDQTPLTAADVVFTFDRLRSQRTHAPRIQARLADFERIEMVRSDTVRIWARRPSAFLLPALAEVVILPAHVFGRGELQYQPANRRPVGTGPFRLRTWERGERGERGHRLVLERFSRYWGSPPGYETIEVLFEEDAAQALGRAKRGEVDVVARVPPAYLPEQLDSPTLRANYHTVRVEPFRFVFVQWNLGHPPLDRPEVRRALALAVDRARLLAVARHGQGRPLAAPPLGDPKTAPTPHEDPVEAARVLGAAGLLRAKDATDPLPGSVPGRSGRLTLLVPSGSHEAEELGRRLVEVFGKLGVPMEMVSGDLGSILMRLRKGLFDGALLEWTGRPGDDLAPLFHSRGAHNYGGYHNPEIDTLLDAWHRPSAPGDEDERRELGARIEAALAADPPALFLYAPTEVFLYSRRLATAPRWGDFLLLRGLSPAGAAAK
jgi:peptide/nickel transport system substrate-binding protein